MGPDAMILLFWMLSLKPAFSLSSFTLIRREDSSSSLSPIRVVSSVYLRLLIFLLENLIPACDSSSLAFHMMYSAWWWWWFSHWVVSSSCDPMDCSLPGSSVHRILQARMEWVAISFSRGSSQPRNWTCVSCIAGRFFTTWTRREAPYKLNKQNDSVQPCHTPFPILNQSVVQVWF